MHSVRLSRQREERLEASYVLPIAVPEPAGDEFRGYLAFLSEMLEVVVVDGSPPQVAARHRRLWPPDICVVAPDPGLRTANGKVGAILTGVRIAGHDRVILADEDVRYRAEELERVLEHLDSAAVVRPQNYFAPSPWHAHWDTGRILINRFLGGDWPGTMGVRRSWLLGCGGYRGDVLFENLELVRTVRAAGGIEIRDDSLYVRRLPPRARDFLRQRVRQAYDEFARPVRLFGALALIPGLVLCWARGLGASALSVTVLASLVAAEMGRRRAGGRAVFSVIDTACAPLWVGERAVTSWLALYVRLRHGGIGYRHARLRDAASPMRDLVAHRRPPVAQPSGPGGS